MVVVSRFALLFNAKWWWCWRTLSLIIEFLSGMVSIFCNRLGWVHMERLLCSFQSRLFHGVAEELVDLLRLLPAVNAQRARALYTGGYSSLSALANARPRDVARLLQRAIPFER